MQYFAPLNGYAEGTTEQIDATTEVAIPVGSTLGGRRLRLREVSIQHVSGSAAHYAPRVGCRTGFAVGDIPGTAWQGGATAVGTSTIDVTVDTVRDYSEGFIYLLCNPDTGSDNIFRYVLAYDVLA